MLGLATFSSALVLSLATLAAAGNHESFKRRHVGTARLEQNHTLSKRFDNARFSFYEAGLGACGKYNNDGDFIVAMNSGQYAGGSHCFEQITISYKGKSTQATVVDECPGCPYGGLDLTPGLFSFFASQDEGIIYGEWDFGGASKPTTPPPATTTEKPDPPPSPTTHSTKKTSSTPSPTPSSVVELKASSTSSSSSSPPPSSSSVASSTAQPSSTSSSAAPTPTATSAIDSTNGALLQMIMLAISSEQSGSQ